MLRVSKFTDYGVLILNAMADVGAIKLSADELSQSTGLSIATVRKVMKTLVDNGFVTAQRGAKGGYRLALSAAQTRMLDIVEAFEGPIAITDCVSEGHDCEIEQCTLSNQWGSINNWLVEFLACISLQDLRDPERQQQKIEAVLADPQFINIRHL